MDTNTNNEKTFYYIFSEDGKFTPGLSKINDILYIYLHDSFDTINYPEKPKKLLKLIDIQNNLLTLEKYYNTKYKDCLMFHKVNEAWVPIHKTDIKFKIKKIKKTYEIIDISQEELSKIIELNKQKENDEKRIKINTIIDKLHSLNVENLSYDYISKLEDLTNLKVCQIVNNLAESRESSSRIFHE